MLSKPSPGSDHDESKMLLSVPSPGSDASDEGKQDADAQTSVALDNAKFLMMVLVIMTHTQTYTWPGHQMILTFIHPFQTRTFCFISGVLTRDTRSVEMAKACSKITRMVIAPLLSYCILFQPLLFQVTRHHGQLPGSVSEYLETVIELLFSSGSQVHWYLFGLFWWRLSALLLQPFTTGIRIAVSFMLSAALTYETFSLFSLTESFACLPIFIVGQALRDRVLEQEQLRKHMDTQKYRYTAIMGGLVFLALHTVHASTGLSQHYPFSKGSVPWALKEASYTNAGFCGALAWMLRGVFGNTVMLAKISTFLWFCCPASDYVWTVLGRHSLYPYLLHVGLAVPLHAKMLKFLHLWYASSLAQVTFAWILELAFCCAACAALASKPVRVLFGAFFLR